MQVIRMEDVLVGSAVLTDEGQPVHTPTPILGRLLGTVTKADLIAALAAMPESGDTDFERTPASPEVPGMTPSGLRIVTVEEEE